jgi:hypothetical protein
LRKWRNRKEGDHAKTPRGAKLNKQQLREKIREEREREWIRDSLMLRDKRPGDTLKTLFDLCDFAQKLANRQN